jgi:predicted RNA-binding Zn-ribbon protein involved in translation (DUF1610 family)
VKGEFWIEVHEAAMSISFQCPQCDKKLKAPDSATSKSSSCPRCNAVVTCPEPIFEAEVVVTKPSSANPPQFNAYTDLHDGNPYAFADESPASEESSRKRRPCPMCGEKIIATATKCHFCGEVFDPVPLKPKSNKTKKKFRASGWSGGSRDGLRELLVSLVCFGIGMVLTVGGFIRAAGNPNGGRYFVFYGLIIGGLVGIVRGVTNMANSDR